MTTIPQLYSLFLQHPAVCTDTRNIIPGSIFFALKGENFNANTFAAQAIEKGCVYAVIDEAVYGKENHERFILVADVLKTLQDLAACHRKQLQLPIIGITGTNGKTTTKELIHSVLKQKYNCFATKGNLNNHIGVPLSLLSLTKEHELAVIEMGASKPGDIQELCDIAFPDYGIITNIGRAHLEGMGGFEGVLKTKTELYRHIKQHGKLLFVNADDELLLEQAKGFEQFTYGTSEHADVVGKLVKSEGNLAVRWQSLTPGPSPKERGARRGLEDRQDSLGSKPATRLSPSPSERAGIAFGKPSATEGGEATSHLPGSYNFPNILAAIAIGVYFELTPEEINKGIEDYIPTNNRSQVVKKGTNTILMDAYNANPSSVEAALKNFEGIAATQKVILLGEMLELGITSQQEHEHIIELVEKMNVQQTCFVGNNFFVLKEKYPRHTYFKDVNELAEFLKKDPISDSLILVKGSRGNRMEKVMEVL